MEKNSQAARVKLTSVSKSESTASGASTDDKKDSNLPISACYESGNNNVLAYIMNNHIIIASYNQISHVLSNIHGLDMQVELLSL